MHKFKQGLLYIGLNPGVLFEHPAISNCISAQGAILLKAHEEINLYRVKIAEEAVPDLRSSLMSTGLVRYTERIPFRKLHAQNNIPNDPDIGSQWYLDTMQVYNAWDYTLGDPSIVIAHLDTGIGLNQADCPLSIVHPQNFFHFPPDTNVQDVYDHGSGTSAIMVAATNNGTGMAGIARNCSLMPIVVDWDNGFQDNDFLVDGLMWAANNGAHVINMSYESLTFDIFSEPAAIQYAYAAGCTLVVSAGNDGFSHLPYPAVYPQCIPVTSVNQAAGFSGFNNYSTAVQLCGPGEGIYTMTLWNNGYSSENGTSYSAPMVSAVAGLVKSVNPALTNVQVLNCLLAGADAVPYDSRVPSMVGRVNALGAVKAAKATTASTGKSQVGYR